MFQRTFPLLPLAAILLVAGCSGTVNRNLESVHQPVVARNDYSLDVATGDGGLSQGEPRRLAGWLSSLRLGYGDQVAVDDPARDPAAREAVAATVARFGLLVMEDAPAPAGAPVAPGTVRVVVSRVTARVPNCPDYSRPTLPDFTGSATSNFGCATNSNLAAMVANPLDLVRGEAGSGTADPATAGKAIDALRKASGSSNGTPGSAGAAGTGGASGTGGVSSTGGK